MPSLGLQLPDEVDGIFIGGGHNSLVAATYLARAGLQVLVLEATDRLGGGMATTEATLPLFRHNLHAHFIRWQPDNPVWRDLRIDRYGVNTMFPDVQDAIVVDGGARALLHYRDPVKSRDALEYFSPRDAKAFEQLYDECGRIGAAIITPLRFIPPLPPDEQDELLSESALGRRYLELSQASALEVIETWFDSDAARVLVAFNVAVRGYQPVMDVPGTGYAAAMALPAASAAQLIEGGSREVARGLTTALYEAGGSAMTNARVARIDVAGGRACGVTLRDERRIMARQFVASSVPAPITLLDLVGKQHLDASLSRRMESYQWNTDYALFGFHLALRDRPRFIVEADHPDLPLAHDIALGYEAATDLLDEIAEVRQGRVGAFRVQTTIPTVHDPSQAPPGHHVMFGWKVVPPGMSDADGAVARQLVEGYARYAPNLPDVTLAVAGHAPADIADTFASMPGGDHLHGSFHPDNYGYHRPDTQLSQFRTPVEGLYLCGSSQHPGGGFSGAQGFIAAGVIADDLDVPVWWSRPDARAVLRTLGE